MNSILSFLINSRFSWLQQDKYIQSKYHVIINKKEVKKSMGKKASLPSDAKVGTKITKKINVKGNKRKLTYERTQAHGKNRNLKWKIRSNKPT